MLHVRRIDTSRTAADPLYAPGLVGPQPGACIGGAARGQGAMMRTTTKTCWLSGLAMSLLALGCGGSPTTTDAEQVQLVLRTQPSGAVLGEPLTTQPVLEVQDANGNLISSDDSTVVAAAIGGGGGMLGGNRTAVAVGGVITFADLAIGGRVGKRTLVFTVVAGISVSGLAPVTSQSFELLPGVANAVIRLSGHEQTGRPFYQLGDMLVVIVTASDGNAASGESTAWSILSGGGSLEVLDRTTDADGLSRAVWTLGPVRAANTATATVAGKGAVTFQAAAVARLQRAARALTDPVEAPLAGVYIHGNLAFVGGTGTGYYTSANIGVRIVDVSNPFAPVLVGRIPLRHLGFQSISRGDAVATHITSGAFQGDVAIVLYGVPNEFRPQPYPAPYGIWDVTDPSNPTFLISSTSGRRHSDLSKETWATSPMTRWQWQETTSMYSTTGTGDQGIGETPSMRTLA